MLRSLPILMALGIATLGATASAQTVEDINKSRVVAVDASRDMNQDNDKITTTVKNTSMSEKTRIEDSFQNNSKTSTNSHNTNRSTSTFRNDSTNLSNVGNGLAKPVAMNTLEATVCGNRVLNVAKAGSTAANVRIDGSLNGFKGISSLNSNTGANSIQQSSVSIAAVTR